ncbi:hypothetical protein GOP47_0025285 [Adiantum capillus-veneris]|uniref:BHLH domain-containing protein n=1 Tax=Adiantum capillus-veneris TaxID=13818 RepID=A0A9D4U2I9_ADICA|nr:hypothetical protein GOP47_0025285 [Adiantum capillus-veneris]
MGVGHRPVPPVRSISGMGQMIQKKALSRASSNRTTVSPRALPSSGFSVEQLACSSSGNCQSASQQDVHAGGLPTRKGGGVSQKPPSEPRAEVFELQLLERECHTIRKEGTQHLQEQNRHQHHLKNRASALVPNDDMLDTLTPAGLQKVEGTHSTDMTVCSSIPALDVPVAMNNSPGVPDDEMLSWLRYPLEDSVDRSYCSGVFGELVHPRVQLVKDVFLHQTMKEHEGAHVRNIGDCVGSGVGLQQPTSTVNTIISPREVIKSDAAMALGAGRAAGFLPQNGLEAFDGVRTHLSPCALLKSMSSPTVESTLHCKNAVQTMRPVPAAPPLSPGLNFSAFSRPVATTLDKLRLVGAASGPTNEDRARKPIMIDSQLPCNPSNSDSTKSMVVSSRSSQQSTEFASQGRTENVGAVYQTWYPPTSGHCGSVGRGHMEAAELNNCVSRVSVSESVLETTEAVELIVSPSCLSGNSSEKVAQEVLIPSPKKSSSSAQFSEQQDAEDIVPNAKKPPPGPRAVKRSRAAEVHNESEKKRRNKINVRLKALQSLIPNSNKTDKASVLDEAIEYTKMLQAQVQFMSMKTGMFFPTMMPAGMHYVPMQQMPTFAHLGMGMGMGVDVGFGIQVADANVANSGVVGVGSTADAGAGAGAAINISPTSHQPLSSHAYAGSRLLQTISPSPILDVSGGLQTACTSESYKVMLAQQSLQPVLMNVQMNADAYSASQQQRLLEENHITSAF